MCCRGPEIRQDRFSSQKAIVLKKISKTKYDFFYAAYYELYNYREVNLEMNKDTRAKHPSHAKKQRGSVPHVDMGDWKRFCSHRSQFQVLCGNPILIHLQVSVSGL